MAHANLDGANLIDVQAHGADMSSANLVGAVLAGAISVPTHLPTHIYCLLTVLRKDLFIAQTRA